MLLQRSGTPGAERVCGSRDGLGVGVGRNSQVGVLAFRIEARAGLTDFREVPVALYDRALVLRLRSEEHTSELQSLMRISYAVFCLKKKKTYQNSHHYNNQHNIMIFTSTFRHIINDRHIYDI